jgi:hypothetical protein
MKRPKRSGAGGKSSHLLDTSTLPWALGEPERLSLRARRLVETGENVVSVALGFLHSTRTRSTES